MKIRRAIQATKSKWRKSNLKGKRRGAGFGVRDSVGRSANRGVRSSVFGIRYSVFGIRGVKKNFSLSLDEFFHILLEPVHPLRLLQDVKQDGIS